MKECQYPSEVNVIIADKYYDNIDEYASITLNTLKIPEVNIRTLHSVLETSDAKEIIAWNEENVIFPHTLNLNLSSLSAGEYPIIAWGNYIPGKEVLKTLHRQGAEEADLFAAEETITIDSQPQESVTLYMRRIKGYLFIIVNNLPEHIIRISQNVTAIFQSIDNDFTYHGSTSIQKEFTGFPVGTALLESILAPSAIGDSSKLILTFETDTQTSNTLAKSIELDIRIERNQITGIRLDYDTEKQSFIASLYINDQWETVKYLEIDLITI